MKKSPGKIAWAFSWVEDSDDSVCGGTGNVDAGSVARSASGEPEIGDAIVVGGA